MKFSISKFKILLTISFGILFFGVSFAALGGKSVENCKSSTSCVQDDDYSKIVECRVPPKESSSNATEGVEWFSTSDMNNIGIDLELFYGVFITDKPKVSDVVSLQEKIVQFSEITGECKLSCVDGRFGSETKGAVKANCVPCTEIGYKEPDANGKCSGTDKLTTDYSDDFRLEGSDYSRSCCVPEEGVTTAAKSTNCKKYRYKGKTEECCGVLLNTDVPFIGKCISFASNGTTPLNAFPRLMGGLSKIMITAILVFSFMSIIAGGVMIASSGVNENGYGDGKKLIMKVIVGIALLGASGVILRLINPNFFG